MKPFQTIIGIMVMIFTSIALLGLSVKNQAMGTLYKADKWYDMYWKKEVNEKVTILIAEKLITATFGKRVWKYTIVSSEAASDSLMNYTVSFRGNNGVITVEKKQLERVCITINTSEICTTDISSVPVGKTQ